MDSANDELWLASYGLVEFGAAYARTALLRSCGVPSDSSFTEVRGVAIVRGVGFFDTLHGQRGVAPNGIELHPVLASPASPGLL